MGNEDYDNKGDYYNNNQRYNNRRNQHPNQHQGQQYIDPNYYSQNNMQMQMMNQGFFNPRHQAPNPYMGNPMGQMGGMGRGRFPQRFVKSRFLGFLTGIYLNSKMLSIFCL